MNNADRLLEGEDLLTIVAADARHWISLYRQMIDFKMVLLTRVHSGLRDLPAEGRTDVVEHEVGLIQSQLERYERRLELWYERQWQLEGLHIDHDSRSMTHRGRTIDLTMREYQLMSALVSRSPDFITAQKLLAHAWHNSDLPQESLRSYIVRIRKKLVEIGVGAKLLNLPRRGYAIQFTTSRS